MDLKDFLEEIYLDTYYDKLKSLNLNQIIRVKDLSCFKDVFEPNHLHFVLFEQEVEALKAKQINTSIPSPSVVNLVDVESSSNQSITGQTSSDNQSITAQTSSINQPIIAPTSSTNESNADQTSSINQSITAQTSTNESNAVQTSSADESEAEGEKKRTTKRKIKKYNDHYDSSEELDENEKCIKMTDIEQLVNSIKDTDSQQDINDKVKNFLLNQRDQGKRIIFLFFNI